MCYYREGIDVGEERYSTNCISKELFFAGSPSLNALHRGKYGVVGGKGGEMKQILLSKRNMERERCAASQKNENIS